MGKNLIETKKYALTRFCCMDGKLGYQITGDGHGDALFDWVQLTKDDLVDILAAIMEDE